MTCHALPHHPSANKSNRSVIHEWIIQALERAMSKTHALNFLLSRGNSVVPMAGPYSIPQNLCYLPSPPLPSRKDEVRPLREEDFSLIALVSAGGQDKLASMRRTRLLATLGPASDSDEILAGLIDAGADTFRLNMSHSPHEWARDLATRVRKGASGVWGGEPMLPHEENTMDELKKMVTWVLATQDDAASGLTLVGIEGQFVPTKENDNPNGLYVLTASYTDHGAEGFEGVPSLSATDLRVLCPCGSLPRVARLCRLVSATTFSLDAIAIYSTPTGRQRPA